MCNFYGYKVDKETFIQLKKIERQFGTDAALDLLRSGFEYKDWPVITATADKQDWEQRMMHWEFIPWWIKTMDDVIAARKSGIPWLNATCEKLLESKMFRDAALKRRCLIPATHFFEWRHFKPEGSKKDIAYPYLITMADESLFYMAGIWQPWTDKDSGETMDTFAIVTTQANALMEQVHNKKKRQPTILPVELAEEWIFEDLTEQRIKEIAAYQLPADQMKATSIRKDFKAVEDPLEVFIYNELPGLI
jgi:putative SOS response-associated peptidase YedK